MYIGPCIIVIVEELRDQLEVTSYCVLFHFYAQHVSDINTSIIRRPRLFYCYHHIGRVFLFRCVLEFRCGWVGVVSVLQASACYTDDGCINVRNMLNIEEVK